MVAVHVAQRQSTPRLHDPGGSGSTPDMDATRSRLHPAAGNPTRAQARGVRLASQHQRRGLMPARNNRGLAPGFAEAYRMFEREQLPVRLGEPGKHIYALRQLEARQESAQRRGPRAFADLLQKAAPHIHALGDKWVELCDKDSDNPLPGKQVIADLGLVSSNTK